MVFFKRLIFIATALGLGGCQNKEVGPQSPVNNGQGIFAYHDGILIGNEGTFQFGNASVGYFQPENQLSADQVFEQVNGLPLGDVLQSMYFHENDLYLVVNNSARIAVVDPATMRLRRDFHGLGSPRYVVRRDNRLFVTQLFDPRLWVLDAESGAVLNKWDTPGWTERMVMSDTLLWVEDLTNGSLLGYDLYGDSLAVQISLPGAVSDLLPAAGRLYALTHAGIGSDLVEMDPSSGFIMRTADLGALDAAYLNYVEEEDAFYFWSAGGIYRFRRSEWTLQPTPLTETGTANVGGLYRDPDRGDWYYTDVLDFATRGWLHWLDPNFVPLDTFRTGFIPRIVVRPTE